MPTADDHRPDEQVADAHGAAEAHDPQRHDPAPHGSCSRVCSVVFSAVMKAK